MLVVAALTNGSVEYLKRVGWLDSGAYTKFMETYCYGPESGWCYCMRDPQSGPAYTDSGNVPDEEYIYSNIGYERLLKIFKDALFVGFILLSFYLIQAQRGPLPDSEVLVLPILLLTSVGIGFFISLHARGGMFALLGLRSFGFLTIALIGGWAFAGIEGIAKCVAALLVLQLVLVGIEWLIGIPLRDCPLSFRAVSTMVLPNSLGIFAVVGLAFYYSYSSDRACFPLLVAVTALLLLASGSATGVLVLFIFLGVCLLNNFTKSRKLMVAAALLPLIVALAAILPALVNRPDVYNSITGRFDKLIEVLSESTATEILVGRGVGVGTNAAANLFSSGVVGESSAEPSADMGDYFTVDSTVTLLLTQLGMIGVVLFYGMLVWAYGRDPGARPIYLVLGITSLTMNITELFPVNFLLGLTLAGTLTLSARAGGLSLHDQQLPDVDGLRRPSDLGHRMMSGRTADNGTYVRY